MARLPSLLPCLSLMVYYSDVAPMNINCTFPMLILCANSLTHNYSFWLTVMSWAIVTPSGCLIYSSVLARMTSWCEWSTGHVGH